MNQRDQAESIADEALIVEARAGSRRSFEALVRRYQRPVYRMLVRYVRNHDEAADLTQRTFIRALSGLGRLREPPVFKNWLFRIAVNLAFNSLRDRARFIDSPQPGERWEAPIGTQRLEAEELGRALREAVGRLPTKQRVTLELRVFEELSFKEIAEVLDTTAGAAKVNFHYAVRRLKEVMSRASGHEGAR